MRRWSPQELGYAHPTIYISKILNGISGNGIISSNVFAVLFDSTQETAPRAYIEPRSDGNRADPSRECSYPR